MRAKIFAGNANPEAQKQRYTARNTTARSRSQLGTGGNHTVRDWNCVLHLSAYLGLGRQVMSVCASNVPWRGNAAAPQSATPGRTQLGCIELY